MIDERTDIVAQTLRDHIGVGSHKPVSYLPVRTIEDVIGITVAAYGSMVEANGGKCIVVEPDICCIKSGAVYAYSEHELAAILNRNAALLSANGWPSDPDAFIRRLASKWLPDDAPVMKVVKAAFGEPEPLPP